MNLFFYLKGLHIKSKVSSLILLILILAFMPALLAGQEATEITREGAAKIFLDCRSCDMNYTREQIPYVNYVRDVKEAEIFILVTQQSSGSGGNMYTYTFNGQYRFDGMNDTLVYSSSPDETQSVTREKRTNLLKMGLMRYVAQTPMANEIIIRHDEKLKAEEVVDNWNNWVFELSTSPRFNAEESFSRLFFSNSIEVMKF